MPIPSKGASQIGIEVLKEKMGSVMKSHVYASVCCLRWNSVNHLYSEETKLMPKQRSGGYLHLYEARMIKTHQVQGLITLIFLSVRNDSITCDNDERP